MKLADLYAGQNPDERTREVVDAIMGAHDELDHGCRCSSHHLIKTCATSRRVLFALKKLADDLRRVASEDIP